MPCQGFARGQPVIDQQPTVEWQNSCFSVRPSEKERVAADNVAHADRFVPQEVVGALWPTMFGKVAARRDKNAAGVADRLALHGAVVAWTQSYRDVCCFPHEVDPFIG